VHRHSLLLQTSHVAWSVCLPHGCAGQIWQNQLRCRFRDRLLWIQGTMDYIRDVKIVFFWYLILGSKNSIFSDYRLSAVVRNWFRWVSSPAVHQHADVSLVVPSAPWPHDPLHLRLQQQWCIPPTATVWRIQALARRTVTRVSWVNDCCDDVRYRRSSVTARQGRHQKAYRRRHATWWSNW